MSDFTFLEQFVATYAWSKAPAKRRFQFRKVVNRGMREKHRLALTLGGVIDRALDDIEGLQASDYSTYQIFDADDLVFKLIDLENIKTSRVGYVSCRGIMSPAYIRLKPSHKHTHSKYYYWFFYGAYLNNIFNGMGGGVRQNLTPTDLLEFPVPIPDLETQKAIADFLDRETARIDLLIEKKQRMVRLLPEKEKNEVSRLVMSGSNPSVACRDTGIFWRGLAPTHWTESRLKAHFRIRKRQGFDKLTVLSVYREYGVIEKSSRNDNINKTPEDLSKYQLVEPGDLVINKMKSWQGSLGVSSFKGITSPDYVVMIPCAQNHPQYMHHLLRALPMPTVYHLISNGIRTDQWRMEPERFRSLPVFLPPMDEQEEIAKKVDEVLVRLRKIADTINSSIDRLQEYRAALITAAVTGQIDVTTYGKHGQADRRLDEIEEALQA